jgi:formylglycine-generating enzyme required for sulfatase activity
MPDAPVFDSNWHDRSHPIVNVSWNEASAYCDWAGGRLPTEAEWERAARGKREGSLYPWGNSINHEYANYGNDKGTGGMALGRDRWEFTAPVASFDPNGLGLYDMAGNVMEWVKDWFSDKYYAGAPSVDPRGPLTGSYRVLKGGGWKNGPRPLRSSWRFSGQQSAKRDYIGFRCACDDLPDRH